MNSKDDLLDELYQVRDSFVPVTHFLTGRKLRDENKQRAHIKKSLNCFHLIGKCFFFFGLPCWVSPKHELFPILGWFPLKKKQKAVHNTIRQKLCKE